MKSTIAALLTILFMCALHSSHAGGEEESPLIGTWASDRERILSELYAMDDPPEQVIQCFEAKLCGSHVVEFMEDEYWTTLFDKEGNEISHEKAPYKILEKGDGFIVIDQMKNGGISKIFFIDNGFYIDVPEFGYRDYHKRVELEK